MKVIKGALIALLVAGLVLAVTGLVWWIPATSAIKADPSPLLRARARERARIWIQYKQIRLPL